MQLRIQTPNGTTTIELGNANGNGAQPTGAPGESALQILSGWGHGATSGLGGADWVAGCGVFRGESYRMGASFSQEANNKAECEAAGISRICSPSMPFGVWLFPWRIPIAANSTVRVNLTMPVAARLFAYEVCIRPVPLPPPEPPAVNPELPCGCGCDCDGACSMVNVSGWKSRQITSTYPGLGDQTGFTAGAPAVVTLYDPNVEVVPACYYSRQRLLDGQNFLPPWVPNVDLKNGNDSLTWNLINTNPAGGNDVVAETILHIKYGTYDLTNAAQDYAFNKAACAC